LRIFDYIPVHERTLLHFEFVDIYNDCLLE